MENKMTSFTLEQLGQIFYDMTTGVKPQIIATRYGASQQDLLACPSHFCDRLVTLCETKLERELSPHESKDYDTIMKTMRRIYEN